MLHDGEAVAFFAIHQPWDFANMPRMNTADAAMHQATAGPAEAHIGGDDGDGDGGGRASEREGEPLFDVVWPKAPLGVQQRQPALRLDTLAGKRIGFVWDYLFRGEELFPAIASELRSRFAGVEIVGYEVFGNVHGPHEHALVASLPHTANIHLVDAVIVGNGC